MILITIILSIFCDFKNTINRLNIALTIKRG